MTHNSPLVIALLTILGLVSGSFINALVWRIKNRRNFISERSECTHCHHVLSWYDLIPLLSWLQLKGRCRYCQKKIDDTPIVEALMPVLFVISYIYWPYSLQSGLEMIQLGLWMVGLVLLVALAYYDLKWMILPTQLVYCWGLIVIFYKFLEWRLVGSEVLVEGVLGLIILGGLFWLMYQLSNGKWIGGGDVRLLFFIGLLLGWRKGLLAIVAASYLGLLVIMMLVLVKKYKKHMRIPFGPLLIAGTVVAMIFGDRIVNVYLRWNGL